jgi:hypothetical protein
MENPPRAERGGAPREFWVLLHAGEPPALHFIRDIRDIRV